MTAPTNAANLPQQLEQGHATMDFGHSAARPGSGAGNPLDIGHHTTAFLTHIVADALDSERQIMALLKTILADATLHGGFPIETGRAIHQVLVSHAAAVNGPACRFPHCDCQPVACAESPRPQHHADPRHHDDPDHHPA